MSECEHKRKLYVSGKCDDRVSVSTSTDAHHGYMIEGIGLGGGDYIRLEICMDCQRVIGLAPASIIDDRLYEVVESGGDYDDDTEGD